MQSIKKIVRQIFSGKPAEKKRIFISGTGRAGTTYLVQLFAQLGFDTGTWTENDYFQIPHAGLERNIFDPGPYQVIKSPFLCDQVDAVLAANVQIDHVIIPIRRIEDAAASRIRVQEISTGERDVGKAGGVPGGLWDTTSADDQVNILHRKLSSLVEALVRHDIPMTLVAFPRITSDPGYLYRKLAPLMPGISLKTFREAFAQVAKPELVHSFGR